jgi:hypothetical protein
MMSALNRGTSLYHGTQAYFCRNQQGDLLGITGHSAADVKLAWNRIIRPLILLEVPRVTVVESSSTIRSMTLGPLSHFGGDRPAFHCSFQHKIKEVQADGDHGHYYGIICCIYPSRGEVKNNLDSQLRESIENAILLQSMNTRWMSHEMTDEARMVQTAESITILFEETLGNTHSVDGWQTEGRRLFLSQVQHFVSRQQLVEFVLPGFPCKSPNSGKVGGGIPDKAEGLALQWLQSFLSQVKKTYPIGARLTVVNDGHVFSDCHK